MSSRHQGDDPSQHDQPRQDEYPNHKHEYEVKNDVAFCTVVGCFYWETIEPPKMLPGQEPYTSTETRQLYDLVRDTAARPARARSGGNAR